MMKKRVLSVLLLLVVLTTSCEKLENLVEKTFQSEDLIDVSYGADVNNKMDVYLPADRNENTKIVFLIHGGSWYSGDKNEFTQHAISLRKKGFAVVNLNYRLVNTSGNVKLAEQQADIKAAVDLAYSKASEWGVSNKIGVLGASAGAHLALYYTYANNADGKVKTVISLAGPANLTDTRNVNPQLIGIATQLVGASVITQPQIYWEASPIAKVTATSMPTLIFHGKKDVIVPVQQSIDLKAKLDASNVKSKLVLYENTGHEVIDLNNMTEFMTEVETWLNENIK